LKQLVALVSRVRLECVPQLPALQLPAERVHEESGVARLQLGEQRLQLLQLIGTQACMLQPLVHLLAAWLGGGVPSSSSRLEWEGERENEQRE
jgi:hypothetical protein